MLESSHASSSMHAAPGPGSPGPPPLLSWLFPAWVPAAGQQQRWPAWVQFKESVGQVWDESASGLVGPLGSSGHLGAGWEWRGWRETEASGTGLLVTAQEAREALGVLLVIVHLGPGIMGREEAPAAELDVGLGKEKDCGQLSG